MIKKRAKSCLLQFQQKNDARISLFLPQGIFMPFMGDLSCCISAHSRFWGGLCASSQITVWRLSMKKILALILLCAILLSMVLTGCAHSSFNKSCSLSFSYKSSIKKADTGYLLYIDLYTTNTGRSFKYAGTPDDQFGKANLVYVGSEEISFSCKSGEEPISPVSTVQIWKKGEQNHKRYTFRLDSQPPEGKYELSFFINGIRCTVPIEMTYQ